MTGAKVTSRPGSELLLHWSNFCQISKIFLDDYHKDNTERVMLPTLSSIKNLEESNKTSYTVFFFAKKNFTLLKFFNILLKPIIGSVGSPLLSTYNIPVNKERFWCLSQMAGKKVSSSCPNICTCLDTKMGMVSGLKFIFWLF